MIRKCFGWAPYIKELCVIVNSKRDKQDSEDSLDHSYSKHELRFKCS